MVGRYNLSPSPLFRKRIVALFRLLKPTSTVRCQLDKTTSVPHATNISVLLYLDHATAVAYVNKKGGSRSHRLNGITMDIISWCESRSIFLHAQYLSVGLPQYHCRSRVQGKTDANDWKLTSKLFLAIAKRWPMKTDLFASAWNTQLEKFISWKPQPNAWRVNALASNWSNLQGYAFPPIILARSFY